MQITWQMRVGAAVLLASLLSAVTMFLADVLQAPLDPRVRALR
jgi:ABC-type dipeptide/oligopeptide/nickel transport system permease component